MPFREKAKNLFKSSRNRNGSSSTDTSSNHDVYKPGEAMPPPKYRRAPAKEHTEKLEAFSFADAWRKRSFQSSHSPMGTCAQNSRRQSAASVRGTKGRKSVTNAGGDGNEAAVVGADRLPTEPEAEGDDDVANVGLSRVQSKDRSAHGYVLHKTMSTAHDHKPFSEQDIANALHRSHLQVSAH